MTNPVFRFGLSDGTRFSSVYRFWKARGNKADFYFAMRNVSDDIHVSFHESGECHTTLTLVNNLNSLGIPHNQPRHGTIWQMPGEFAPGLTSAFKLIVPASELTRFPPPPNVSKGVKWFGCPADGYVAEFSIIVSAKNSILATWPGAEAGSEHLFSMPLPEEKTVWLVRLDRPESIDDLNSMDLVRNQSRATKGFRGEPLPPMERLRAFAFGITSMCEGMLIEFNIQPPPSPQG